MTAIPLVRTGATETPNAAWRGITRTGVKAAFLFGLAVSCYHLVVWPGALLKPDLWRPLLATFVLGQIWGFALFATLVIANTVSTEGGDRRGPYAIALIGGSIAVALIESLFSLWFARHNTVKEIEWGALYSATEWIVLAGAAMLVYLDRRRASAARARMHEAELERAHAARRTLESRLQAMQARVEPRFLFNTLSQVRELYREDIGFGERMLDELIAYLHAAMPTMRDSTSTVSREIDLVRAWLGIAGPRLGVPIGFEQDADDVVRGKRMPPMMLLPLVERAIAHGCRSIRLGVTNVATTMRITIAGRSIESLADSEELAAVRERLTTLYGADAGIETLTGGDALEVVLFLPAETAVDVAAH